MVTIVRSRRLVNPGRRKRKMTPAQIRFFGTKRQRAALKANRGRKKRRNFSLSSITRKLGITKRHKRRNVGSIITVWPKGNPGRKRRYRRKKVPSGGYTKTGYVKSKWPKRRVNKGAKMARRRTRSRRVYHRRKRRAVAVNPRRRRRVNRSHRRRRNVVYRRRIKRGSYMYSSNPGRRRRRHHRISNRRHYRRNPGMLTGTAGRVLGVVGGVAVTKVLSGFLPATFATGILSYVGIGAIAVLQGKLVGKFSKSSSLGNDMMVGGLAYLAAKVLNDFFPSIGAYTGISGMGLIGGSSFYNPQVNLGGSMGSFVVPSAVLGSFPVATAKGVGSMRRTGRLM